MALKVKTINLVLVLAIILAFGGSMVYLTKDKGDFQAPPGYVLIPGVTWDSIKKIASLPPDTIRVDSFIFISDPIYIDRPVPVPQQIAPEENLYSDSIRTDSVNIWWTARTKGTLEDFDMWYQMMIREITITVDKPVPYLVNVKVPTPENGVYVYGSMGGGFHSGKFTAGVGVDLITKRKRLFGLQYQRMGPDNIVMMHAGVKIPL